MKKILILALCCLLSASAFGQKSKEKALSIRTQDGWLIAGFYLPAQPGKKTVILLHDIGKDHKAFATFAEKLSNHGMGYLALDLRGHGDSTNLGTYRSFAKEGVDNDYNKMTRDVDAAMEYLKSQKVADTDIMWVGAGMGANVAAKATSLWPDVAGIALLTPVTNFRDVLPIAGLRIYKGFVFIAAAADDKKTFLEASVMRNVSFLTNGEGNVTFATAYDKKGHELLDAWVSAELLQWLQMPQRPPLNPDFVEISEPEQQDPYGSYETIGASDTEEALFPSILQAN